MKLILILIALFAALAAWIRLAPSDPDKWHTNPDVTVDEDLEGGVRRVIDGNADTLERLHQIALSTPRTTVLAGSVESGLITYVTRSKGMGFPDYANVALRDGKIEIFSRLRFGKKDLGVNKAKVDGWLAQLGA
ncbi:MAG: DUF1499 domain-containing protein [Pelagimonas sp.]|jgi:hypothetical protein|nr:DUF1499 domain-containing protein [Pelagimonas sp.]